MFQLITPDKLVIGTKYKIVSRDEYSGIYQGPITICDKSYLRFDKIYDLIEEEKYSNPFFFKNCDYYEFISQTPRWKMERRAVNMILRRLIGDNCFEW